MATALTLTIVATGLTAAVRLWQVRRLALRLQQVRHRNTNQHQPLAKG